MSGGRDRPLRARWRSLALDPESTLGPLARLAACAYAEHSTDEQGRLRYPPSAVTLADWMRCSERSAWRARRELVDVGLLELDERPGRTSGARLVFPTPANVAGVTTPDKNDTPDTTPDTTPDRTPARFADGTRGTREGPEGHPLSPPARGAEERDYQQGARAPRRRRDRRTSAEVIADVAARLDAEDDQQ